MNIRNRLGLVLGSVALAGPVGCGSDGAKVSSGAPLDGPDAAAPAAQVPVRSTCGNVPLWSGDYPESSSVPDACKAAVDTSCCDQANACAADPDCVKYRECIGRCPVGQTCDCGAKPQTSADLGNCTNALDACLDLTCATTALPASVPPETLTLRLYLTNFLTGAALPGVRARSCAGADPECANPIDEATSQSDGLVPLKVPAAPAGTDAYIEITGPNVQSTLWYPRFAKGPDKIKNYKFYPGLLDSGTAHALWGAVGAPDELATRGFVTVQAASCDSVARAGMVATSSNGDSRTLPTYFENNLPSASATSTDGSGLVDFIDEAPGPTTIVVTSNGKKYGSADITVRAGFNSVIAVFPQP